MYVLIVTNDEVDLWYVNIIEKTSLNVEGDCSYPTLWVPYIMGYVPLANDWINTSLCTNVSEADFVNVWVNITDELVRW